MSAVQASATPQDPAMRPGRGGVIPPVHARFQPGSSVNPGGRPKGASIREALRALAGGKNAKAKGTRAYEIARTLLDIAADPARADVLPAIREAIANIDGPPKHEVEVNGTTVSYIVEVPPKLALDAWAEKYARGLPEATAR